MDFKTLYRQGVIAIRDANDPEQGRALLLEALKLNPQHDMAWLWLTRTVEDPTQQLNYVSRALAINPANESAQALKTRLMALAKPETRLTPVVADAPSVETSVIQPLSGAAPAAPRRTRRNRMKTVDEPVTDAERDQITMHMEKAAIYLEAGAIEDAIGEWVAVLALRVDHETALRYAAGHLWRQSYRDDAYELVQRALNAGTRIPTIYLTAIDMSERLGRVEEADALRNQVAALPDAEDQLLVAIADDYVDRHLFDAAITFLNDALETHPNRQALVVRLADIYQDTNQHQLALATYERAVRLGARTTDGKAADERLAAFVPVLTDRERGSVLLALRETAGIVLFYLLLAWQDAGIDFLALGPRRWFGVLLSAIGGYLVITATSSPQQRGIAAWFGGQVPPPPLPDEPSDLPALSMTEAALYVPGRAIEDPTQLPRLPADVRYALGAIGLVLLALAFYLVLYRALDLVLG